MKSKIKILVELTKLRITLFVTLTTGVGFIAAAGEFNLNLIAPVVGILILACGSAIVNHIQERNTDALMNRTKGRPIPSGEISVRNATVLALIFIFTGTLILFLGAGLLATGLALLNLIWYNAFYTPLKKKSSLAILPGSLVGAIPPAVGWVAAGGYILDKEIIIISAFFFIWQIPHFWLLMISFDHEYKQAGFPTITKFFNRDQFARIIYVWIVATVVTGLLIPFFNVVEFSFLYYSMLVAGILLTWSAAKLLSREKENFSFRFAFREINLFALLVLLVISVDKLIT
ncbi:MAG: protoheme IX farnesyltransferase [Ignavibacteriaceae bacterium]